MPDICPVFYGIEDYSALSFIHRKQMYAFLNYLITSLPSLSAVDSFIRFIARHITTDEI